MIKRTNLKIANYLISEKNPAFIVAEIGQAHNGSLKNVINYIDKLSNTGVNAVKFQTHYANEESTYDEKFRVKIGNFKSRFNYWKSVEFTFEEWKKIKKYCEKKKLIFLSSVFSLKGFEVIKKLKAPAWKVASGEYNSKYIISKMFRTKKPIIISTGLMRNIEIINMHRYLNRKKVSHCFLHCVSSYPVHLKEAGLNNLNELKKKLNCQIGYSDHSGKIIVPIYAIINGAKIIEVHAKLKKIEKGPDSSSSLTIKEIYDLCKFRDQVHLLQMNPINKNKLSNNLLKIKKLFNKSLALNKNLNKGSKISIKDLTFKKPGTGYNQSKLKYIIGKKLTRFVSSKVILKPIHFK